MNVNWEKIWQHTLLFVLFGIGFIAFMIIAGDDDPNNPLPLSKWFAIKLGAAVVIAACVYIGKYLNKKGLFSEIDFEDYENI